MRKKIDLFLAKYEQPIQQTKGWAFYSLLVAIFLLPMGSILCLIALYIRWKSYLFPNQN